MSGAYTSKPPVVAAFVAPPGWNLYWPFLGPFPPGYTPSYSIAISAPETINVGETATAIVTVYDHSSYLTGEPTGSLSLTGNLDGYDPVIGSTNFALSESGFYTGTVSITPIAADAGKTINWLASSDPFGVSTLTSNASTVVNEESVYTILITMSADDFLSGGIKFTAHCNGDSSDFNWIEPTNPPYAEIYRLQYEHDNDWAYYMIGYYDDNPLYTYGDCSENYMEEYSVGHSFTITGTLVNGNYYTFSILNYAASSLFPTNSTVSYNIKIYKNSELIKDYSKSYIITEQDDGEEDLLTNTHILSFDTNTDLSVEY